MNRQMSWGNSYDKMVQGADGSLAPRRDARLTCSRNSRLTRGEQASHDCASFSRSFASRAAIPAFVRSLIVWRTAGSAMPALVPSLTRRRHSGSPTVRCRCRERTSGSDSASRVRSLIFARTAGLAIRARVFSPWAARTSGSAQKAWPLLLALALEASLRGRRFTCNSL